MNEDERTRVLVVDDDEDIRRLVRTVLDGESYKLLEANNGQDGLTLTITELPDLIVLDRQMPGIDGLEVLREVRAHLTTRPHTGHPPDGDAGCGSARQGASVRGRRLRP